MNQNNVRRPGTSCLFCSFLFAEQQVYNRSIWAQPKTQQKNNIYINIKQEKKRTPIADTNDCIVLSRSSCSIE